MSALLLDTCAVIWVFEDEHIEARARKAIEAAERAQEILISSITAWEIGLLSKARGRKSAKMPFKADVQSFVSQVFAWPSVKTVDLTPAIAFDACNLPGDFHRDPADRFLVATARALDVPIVTRDDGIEAYARAGHVKLIKC